MSALPKSPLLAALDRISQPSTPAAQYVLEQTKALVRIRLEQDLEEAEYQAFTDSMEHGDTQAAQVAYFGNRYQALWDRWHLEHVKHCHECAVELDEDERDLCDDCAARFKVAERGCFRR